MQNDASRRAAFVSRILLSLFYAAAGILHLAAPERFLPIMPEFLPFPVAIILLTGGCEIAGAVGLHIPACSVSQASCWRSTRSRWFRPTSSMRSKASWYQAFPTAGGITARALRATAAHSLDIVDDGLAGAAARRAA